jgi:site-specific recombinase XerD
VRLFPRRKIRQTGFGTFPYRNRRHKLAGVKRVNPHAFRHSAATHMLENGADIRVIQKLLGHASIATTGIYTEVAIRKVKTVHANTHPRA